MLIDEPIYYETGRRIRAARKHAKMTQENLAAKVSLTRTSLTNIEMGRQRFLFHTIIDIAKALKISPSDLMPEIDSIPEVPHVTDALEEQPSNVQQWIRSSISSLEVLRAG